MTINFLSNPILQGILITWLWVTLFWILSIIQKDAGLIDVGWGLGFGLVSTNYFLSYHSMNWFSFVFLIMIWIWAIRLSGHISIRNDNKPEDKRYMAWRNETGDSWYWKSYFKIFLLQGSILWFLSLLFWGGMNSNPMNINPVLIVTGIIVFLTGLVIEAIADLQLLMFKQDSNNDGVVLTSGLWGFSRHPNYFGEAVLWWGFYFYAAAGGFYYLIFAPVIMTYLLMKVSGVKLLDRFMTSDYKNYSAQTAGINSFVLGPRNSAKNLE